MTTTIDQDYHLLKCFLLGTVYEFNIVKPILLEYYVKVVRHEENTVQMPLLFNIGLSHNPSFLSLLRHRLNYLLLYDTEETHFYLLNLLALLFTRPNQSTSLFVEVRQRLVQAALHFEYADILWLYAAQLMNPRRAPVRICANTPRTTDLFLRYLYQQKSSIIHIKTVVQMYELRVTSLFRSVVSLLLGEKRRTEVVDACVFMQQNVGVLEPLFYLKDLVVA